MRTWAASRLPLLADPAPRSRLRPGLTRNSPSSPRMRIGAIRKGRGDARVPPICMADFGSAIRARPQETDHPVPEAGTAFILPSRISLAARLRNPGTRPSANSFKTAGPHRSGPTDRGMKSDAPAAGAGPAGPTGGTGSAIWNDGARSAKSAASRQPGLGDGAATVAVALSGACSSGAIFATYAIVSAGSPRRPDA